MKTAGSRGFAERHHIGRQSAAKLRAALQPCGGNVDNQIGRVLSALNEAGKLDNTVVIITAPWMPLNPQNGEFDWSREQLQVPLVIHWPAFRRRTSRR
jgi:membrane-anchored protein YejM (alkaline phosphatase superfamily)